MAFERLFGKYKEEGEDALREAVKLLAQALMELELGPTSTVVF